MNLKPTTEKTLVAILFFLIAATTGYTQNLSLKDGWEYSFFYDEDLQEELVTLHGGIISNNLGRDTNNLKLKIWATNSPYSGGPITGWVLADYNVNPLPSNKIQTISQISSPVKNGLESGIYYFSLVLLEYRTDNFYVVDHYSFGQIQYTTRVDRLLKEVQKQLEERIDFYSNEDQRSKRPTNIFTDGRDGFVYLTVKIGNQTWMAENLSYNAGNGCWAYSNNKLNVESYGYLYNWETAKNVCPQGWHLPSDTEWTILEREICKSNLCDKYFPIDGSIWGYRGSIEGNYLKHNHNWQSPNSGANNSSGFSALPGGNYIQGKFGSISFVGDWWSSTSINEQCAWGRGLYFDRSTIDRNVNEKGNGFSVRCVR